MKLSNKALRTYKKRFKTAFADFRNNELLYLNRSTASGYAAELYRTGIKGKRFLKMYNAFWRDLDRQAKQWEKTICKSLN